MAWLLLLLALGLLVPLAATPSHAVAPRSAQIGTGHDLISVCSPARAAYARTTTRAHALVIR
jgi:hypothetical protein